MKKLKPFIINLILAWGYGIFNLVLKLLEFKNQFFNEKVYSSFSLSKIFTNTVLLHDLITYVFSFLILYAGLASTCFIIASTILNRLDLSDRIKNTGCYLFLVIVFYSINIVNALDFPQTTNFHPGLFHWILFFILLLLVISAIIPRLTAISFKITSPKQLRKSCIISARHWVLILSAAIGLTFIVNITFAPPLKTDGIIAPKELPNIVIIGIDSLRPDLLLPQSNPKRHIPEKCKNIKKFLEKATVFADAYTPFARTFPAWLSLLTGKYPINNGARYNLIDQKNIIAKNVFLADYLKQKGYYTIYGSDEKRFCNIDSRHGFDAVMGPKAGAGDFLIAPMVQTPLINLIVNTPLGKVLFPYNHANRALASTYKPATFVESMKHSINHLPNKPIFLAFHLCLPHWPFTWADSEIGVNDSYLSSVSRVDKQFGNILKLLKRQLLNNAIVFIISDHGESISALNGQAKMFVNEHGDDFFKVYMPGHGTYVPDRTQFRIVFGVKCFGKFKNSSGIVYQSASLIDIFPTISALLGDPPPIKNFDGISLKKWIESLNHPEYLERTFFAESGFNKDVVFKGDNLKSVIASGIDQYRITDTGHIVLKKDAVEELMKKKQYAIIQKDKSVVILPGKSEIKLIGIDYSAEKWKTLNMDGGDADSYNPLLQNIVTFFKDDPVIKAISTGM